MDKLQVINNALTATGNGRVNMLYDSSDEYQVADNAFDRAVKFLAARHNWPFAIAIEELGRAPDVENKSRRFRKSAFRLPQDALHIREIFYLTVPLTEYEIMGSLVSVNYDSDIFARVIRRPADASWHPLAEEVLTLYVESGCLRGLNEDFRQADATDAKAESLLMEVRPTTNQQNPARNTYKSSIRTARRSRRV